MGAPRRRRRARLRAPLRRRPRQEEDGRAAQEAARRRRRAPARDGRGSRGRGNRLAPARGVEAEGARPADGLPRDHPPRDRAGARGDARRRRATGGRAGVAADPRPALRLRGIARPLEEDHARPLGRPRPVGCHAPRRRARAGADGVPRRRVVGPGRYVRSGLVRGAARLPGRTARGNGPRLRPRREAARRGAPARRGSRPRPRRPAPGLLLQRGPRRAEAVRPPAEPAVHDVDAAAGGEPKAPLLGADDDAARAAPVRERLHHLHAHRLDDAVGVGAHRRARAGHVPLRRRLRPARAAPLRAEGEERAGGTRGDSPLGRPLPHAAGRALGTLARTSTRSTS